MSTIADKSGTGPAEVSAPDARVRSLYEMIHRARERGFYRDVLGIHSTYINYGYWRDGCTDHDEACQALAELVGETVGITAGDRVLDVGFGYAEQDFHWLRTLEPAEIVGVNMAPSQVEAARARAEAEGVADRLDLRVGSATALPFEDDSFDRVVALESSVHFDTRQRFLEEAFRVLRPGGRLATADPLPLAGPRGRRTLAARFDDWRRRRIIPEANWYPRDVYAERLAQAGFTAVDVRDVTEQVIVPNAEYVHDLCTSRLRDPRFKSVKTKAGIRAHMKLTATRASTTGYVIAVAEKPR